MTPLPGKGTDALFGVLDTVMVNAVQNRVEGFGDTVKIAQGQLAVVQLPIGENPVDELLHESLET